MALNSCFNFRSHARWPKEVYSGMDGSCISTDNHGTEEQAKIVCRRLELDGFGGDGQAFPIETWVTPIPYEEQYPEEAAILSEICEERAGKRNKPLFLDSVEPIRGEAKIGRNDPCPCGSGKKFKKCCG